MGEQGGGGMMGKKTMLPASVVQTHAHDPSPRFPCLRSEIVVDEVYVDAFLSLPPSSHALVVPSQHSLTLPLSLSRFAHTESPPPS